MLGRAIVAIIAILFVSAAASVAGAHEPFQITTEARVLVDRVELHSVLVRGTLAQICPGAGLRDARTDADFATARAAVERCALALYALDVDGRALHAERARALLLDEDEVDLRVSFPPARGRVLRFEARFLTRLSDPTYGATLTVTSERAFLGQELLRSDTRTLTVRLPSGSSVAPGTSAGFGSFFRLGVQHILTGADHLLFLLGLLAVCRSVRSVLGVVSCFTIAHSLTLAAAALGVVTPPSRVVEPLIAATIVAIGVENVLRGDDPRARWAFALGFGLVHGFGFAGALKAIGLGANGAPIAEPLFAFNWGVECGQAAVAVIVLPLLWRLRRVAWFERHGANALSVLVAGVGLFWFFERLL